MALSLKAQATYVDGIRYNVIDTVAKTCEVLYETFVENNGTRNIYPAQSFSFPQDNYAFLPDIFSYPIRYLLLQSL